MVGSGENGKNSKCPKENVGASAEGQAKGCEHDDCTAAKNAAKATRWMQNVTNTSKPTAPACEAVDC